MRFQSRTPGARVQEDQIGPSPPFQLRQRRSTGFCRRTLKNQCGHATVVELLVSIPWAPALKPFSNALTFRRPTAALRRGIKHACKRRLDRIYLTAVRGCAGPT